MRPGPHPGGGRPPKQTPSDIQRKIMERYELAVQRPYWRTLGYDIAIDDDGEPQLTELPDGGAKLFGESRDGHIHVSGHDDLGAMIAAAEKLMDRVYGKPRQHTEVKVITRDEMAEAIERMERELADRETRSGYPAGDGQALQDAAGEARSR